MSASQFPYMVSVQGPVVMCEGALVDLKHVVTTATCVSALAPSDVNVRVGSNKYYDGGLSEAVTVITVHPAFDKSTYDSNIAVLTLARTLPAGTSIKPIPLAENDPPGGSLGVVTSFGATNTENALPDLLQQAPLTTLSATQCQNFKGGRVTIRMMCAGDQTGVKDLCPADQGTPLAYQGRLVGIYSWGGSCGLAAPNSSSPVFNRISTFATWINSVMSNG
ncbi:MULTISPECIES: serine protease [unclassified Streptomyces]|uniref:serine protease n=1 Tax=unclassified Streptomyces TaxID=2593676 RepID=UPI002E3663BE|nr:MULTISPECIES: serine protease [unclassified Streptomyces]WUC68375.1 serine protease [Streptomyces sp. NBC_00539]